MDSEETAQTKQIRIGRTRTRTKKRREREELEHIHQQQRKQQKRKLQQQQQQLLQEQQKQQQQKNKNKKQKKHQQQQQEEKEEEKEKEEEEREEEEQQQHQQQDTPQSSLSWETPSQSKPISVAVANTTKIYIDAFVPLLQDEFVHQLSFDCMCSFPTFGCLIAVHNLCYSPLRQYQSGCNNNLGVFHNVWLITKSAYLFVKKKDAYGDCFTIGVFILTDSKIISFTITKADLSYLYNIFVTDCSTRGIIIFGEQRH